MAELDNSIAVVTGGGRGIGKAACLRLADEGATVVAVDIDKDNAERTASQIDEETNGSGLGLEADVSDEADVERIAETVADRFGEVNVIVNNAGIRVTPCPVTEADEESWDRVLGVNLKGAAFCSKHLIPLMPEGGSIINIASEGTTVARRDWSQYDATKGAIVSMTQDMACDHAQDGIRVNALSPGWVITEFHMPEDEKEAEQFLEEKTSPSAEGPGILKRAAKPREIANAIAFLASDEASFITGTNMRVDGGKNAVGHELLWDSHTEGAHDSML